MKHRKEDISPWAWWGLPEASRQPSLGSGSLRLINLDKEGSDLDFLFLSSLGVEVAGASRSPCADEIWAYDEAREARRFLESFRRS